jgi:hypothetical protein
MHLVPLVIYYQIIPRMPNEELDLMPLKEVRSKKRKAFGNTHPSVVYFQVVGSGTPGGTRYRQDLNNQLQ